MIRSVAWLVVISVAFAATPAQAALLLYNLTFTFDPTNTSLIPTTSEVPTGSFLYDTVAVRFSEFLVTWRGHVYDFTPGANFPNGAGLVSCGPNPPTQADVLATLTQTSACGTGAFISFWAAEDSVISSRRFLGLIRGRTDRYAQLSVTEISVPPITVRQASLGTFTISNPIPQDIPEPGSVLLLLAGIAVLAAIRYDRQPTTSRYSESTRVRPSHI